MRDFQINCTSFGSSSTGLPTNITMRILWFFPWRCFKASCNIRTRFRYKMNTKYQSNALNWKHHQQQQKLTWATRTPEENLMLPLGWTWCNRDRTRPTSVVKVTKTSGLRVKLEEYNQKLPKFHQWLEYLSWTTSIRTKVMSPLWICRLTIMNFLNISFDENLVMFSLT